MRMKWLAVLWLPLFVLAGTTARAGEKAADTPTVVIRVQSLDALLQNLNLVVKLVGQEEVANQIEGLVKSKIGKQGLEGIDTTRPFGAYVRFGKAIEEAVTGAVLVPMVDPKTFLGLLENLSINVTKDKDGIYTYKTKKNFDVHFRFAHDYLYITSVNIDSIVDKNLLPPAKALAIPGNAMISFVARVDQIPNDAKLIAVGQLEETIQTARNREQPKESKVQKDFRLALLSEANKLGSSFIREAAELRFDLDINDKTKEMAVNFTVIGKQGSDLAKTIQGIGGLQSPLAGLAKKNAAFHGGLHFALPDSLHKTFAALIDEVKAKSLEGIQKEEKKKQAEMLFSALMPTTKAGEFQLVATVIGPREKHYTFVAALKLKDGDKLGKTVHELLKDALNDIPPNLREKIQLDFETVDKVQIHKFEIPKNDKIDKVLTDALGDNHLYLAFRDDALFLAMGKEALGTLRTVVAKKDGEPSPPLVFDFDFARMAALMAQSPDQRELADKLFADGQNGRVRVTLEGGASLSARMQMRLNVLEFLVKLKNDKEK